MLLSIKQQFKLQWDNLWQFALIMLGMFVVGFIIVSVLVATGVADTTATLASLFAVLGLGFWFFGVGAQMSIGLNNGITMSRTRKGYLAAHYVVSLVYTVAQCALMLLLFQLDRLMLRTFFSHLELDVDFSVFFGWKVLLLVVVAGVVVASFLGALLARYGKTAFWVLWAIWMFTFLVLPRASEAAAESGNATILGMIAIRVVEFFTSIPLSTWKVLGGVGLVVCLISNFLLVRKTAVSN